MGNKCTLTYIAPLKLRNGLYRIASVCLWRNGTPDIRILGSDDHKCGGFAHGAVNLIRDEYVDWLLRPHHYVFKFPDECVGPGESDLGVANYYLEEKGPYIILVAENLNRVTYALPYHRSGNTKLTLQPDGHVGEISVCGSINGEKLRFTYKSNLLGFDGRYYALNGTVNYSLGENQSETSEIVYIVDTMSGVTYPSLPCGERSRILGDDKCFKMKGVSDTVFEISFASPSNEVPTPPKFRIALNVGNDYREFHLDSEGCGNVK